MANCANAPFDLHSLDAISLNTAGSVFSLSGMSWLVLQAVYAYVSDYENWCGSIGQGLENLTAEEVALIDEIVEGVFADLVPLE